MSLSVREEMWTQGLSHLAETAPCRGPICNLDLWPGPSLWLIFFSGFSYSEVFSVSSECDPLDNLLGDGPCALTRERGPVLPTDMRSAHMTHKQGSSQAP